MELTTAGRNGDGDAIRAPLGTANEGRKPPLMRSMSPIVPVRRVARSLPFYTEVLGFEVQEADEGGTFAYLTRDKVGLMLLDLGDHKSVRATSDYMSAYVWVEDAARLYAALEPQLSRLPEKRVTPLMVKPDGRRELHVTDPDGFRMFFGDLGVPRTEG